VVMQEIERASEENLILKDILKCQPQISLSSPTSIQGVTSNRATRISQSMEETRCVQPSFIDREGHFRNMVNTFQLSTSNGRTPFSPCSDFTGLAPTSPPSSEDSEAFGFFMTPSTSHQIQGQHLEVHHGRAEKRDGRALSSSSTMSYSHPNMLNIERYVDLDPYLTTNDSVYPVEQPYNDQSQNGQCRTEPPEYYDMAGISPLRNDVNRISSSAPPRNFGVDIDQSFLLKADPTSARLAYATTSSNHHQEHLEATDWWPETV
jgi:hypothetical protein